MSDKVFLDTNIVVYGSLKEKDNSAKYDRVLSLFADSDLRFNISTQIINEYYRIMLKHNFPDEEIQGRINDLIASSELVLILESTIRLSWSLRKRYSLSFWDSLAVASAVESECNIFYSEDIHHGLLIENKLQIVNPFL